MVAEIGVKYPCLSSPSLLTFYVGLQIFKHSCLRICNLVSPTCLTSFLILSLIILSYSLEDYDWSAWINATHWFWQRPKMGGIFPLRAFFYN